jgi:hypothetical protein
MLLNVEGRIMLEDGLLWTMGLRVRGSLFWKVMYLVFGLWLSVGASTSMKTVVEL